MQPVKVAHDYDLSNDSTDCKKTLLNKLLMNESLRNRRF